MTSWTSYQQDRWDGERIVLNKIFPGFVIMNFLFPNDCYVSGCYSSIYLRHSYTIVIDRLSNFPMAGPKVVIKNPCPLYQWDGSYLPVCSHAFHVNDRRSDGSTELCVNTIWNPSKSLVDLILRAIIWIHCYEEHLCDGNDIEYHYQRFEDAIVNGSKPFPNTSCPVVPVIEVNMPVFKPFKLRNWLES